MIARSNSCSASGSFANLCRTLPSAPTGTVSRPVVISRPTVSSRDLCRPGRPASRRAARPAPPASPRGWPSRRTARAIRRRQRHGEPPARWPRHQRPRGPALVHHRGRRDALRVPGDLAALALLYGCRTPEGPRPSPSTVDDVDLEDGSIAVFGKGQPAAPGLPCGPKATAPLLPLRGFGRDV